MGIEVKNIHRFTGHAAGLYALCLHEGGKKFFSGGSDKILTSWDLDSMKNENFQATLPNIIYSIALIPSTNMLIAGTFSGDLHVMDMTARKEVRIIKTHIAGIFDLKYHEAKDLLVAVSGDGSISFFRGADLSLLGQKKIVSEKVRNIAFSDHRSSVAIAAGDGSNYIFNMDTLELITSFKAHEHSSNCVMYHPEGKYLYSGGRDAHLRIWDTENNYKLTHEIPAHNFALYGMAWHPRESVFATASRDRSIRIWDAADLQPLITMNKEKFDGHANSVNRLVWSPHKNILLSCSDDRTMIAWDIQI